MNFTKFFQMSFVLLFLIMGGLTGCSSVTPDPGEVAVLIDKPLIFGHSGVRSDVVQGGTRQYVWPSTDYSIVTITPQQKLISFDDFSSQDNILLDFSTSVQYRITDAPRIVKNFGSDWFKNNLEAQYTSLVRDAVKKHSMADMMSNPVVAQQVDDEVTGKVRDLVKQTKLPIEIMNVTLGRARPNDNVLAQMNETAAQQQRVKTLAAAVEAEKERQKEQEAKASADNAYRNKMGLSPEQYLVREIAELNANACQKAQSCIMAPSDTHLVIGK